MSKASNDMFRRVVILGIALSGGIALLGGLIGFFVAGTNGLVSALIGASLTAVFGTLTALSVWFGSKLPLGGFFGLVLGGWLVKIIGFSFVIAALTEATFINGPVLFFTLVAAIFGTLAVDTVVVLKARIPVIGD
ncbi:MAG: hypothetical protein F2544_01220 [Actinobacteria bacterium]|uniref:Unannotated protein n=1 Tax=freshwater metagenome TaxID=449393 RepID=A0A6J6IV37_9ZZZZ|nr:hypothetical protein [Actinomycetota bacterium]MSZ22866.1 hypothetical protein [Actinomycetota bacterium]MTA91988.1 hypothetical protein [Actinomycetota bacterium]